jgi:hypothetical protein
MTPVSIVHGERRVRGYRMECCKCGFGESVPVNSLKNGVGDDTARTLQMIARKFEARGWKVGRRIGHDLCMKCVALNIPSPAASRPKLSIVENQTTMPIPASPPAPPPAPSSPFMPDANAPDASPPPPPPVGTDDALTIVGKLHAVYLDKDKGYEPGWTDAKVAADLNVPPAWVKHVRIKFYGTGAALDIDEALTEAVKLLDQCRPMLAAAESLDTEVGKLIAEAGRLSGEATALRDLAGKIESTVASIEQSLK